MSILRHYYLISIFVYSSSFKVYSEIFLQEFSHYGLAQKYVRYSSLGKI